MQTVMKKIFSLFVLIIMSVSNMSAQSIYHTWRGMREADETTSSWLYIAFIDADNSFAMVQEASFADEDLSFDITTRAYGLFSFDGEKLNVMVNENETTSTLDDITFSDEMERQFKKNKVLKANMNNQVRATFKQTKDDFEKDLNKIAERFRHCKVVGITSTKLILQMGTDDDAPIEVFEKDDDFALE